MVSQEYLEELRRKTKGIYDRLVWEEHANGGYQAFHEGVRLHIFSVSSRAHYAIVLKIRDKIGQQETIIAPDPHISQVPLGRGLRWCARFLGLPYPRSWNRPATREEAARERLRVSLEELHRLVQIQNGEEESLSEAGF